MNESLLELVISPTLGQYSHISVPLNFTQGDLFTAVGHATMYYKGRICKTAQGGKLVNLSIRVHDRYDFDFWVKTIFDNPVATIGVDLAWGDQLTGIIEPYIWDAVFKENGYWK